MNGTEVLVTLQKGWTTSKIEGTRVTFSAHKGFDVAAGPEVARCIDALARHLKTRSGLAIMGGGTLLEALLRSPEDLASRVICLIPVREGDLTPATAGLPIASLEALPAEVRHVFLCETMAVPLMRMRQSLPTGLTAVEPTVLADIAPETIPESAWIPLPRNIYPLDVPRISVQSGLDLLLIDCPSRNLALMPNGLAYVHNALRKTSVNFQICDLDIIAYHEFHIHRLFDLGGRVVLPSGRVLPEDPWQAEHYDVWSTLGRNEANEVMEFFRPLIDTAIDAIVRAHPKVLGLSIQQCNEAMSREIVDGVKARCPDIVILVGGFSCYNADIGLKAFPECDYMCVGESDLTVGPLVEALARGERPFNQAGILSRFDTADYGYIPAPMPHNLDQIEFPKYEWASLNVYRNFNDYQLTPIIASRGCRWSRCTFCAERFYWRIRSPQNFVDELEWLVNNGCHLFMFNESDLNGMPERVMEICDEVIRRGLHKKVKLTGQLRIHKKSSRAFFEKLREANFVALRFGVDAFSENTLRLQKKGYTTDMVSQNLKDCWEVGIFTEINWVIGIPGETDADVEEGIQLILKNRQYIGRLANINPLILVNGSVYWIDPESHNIRFKSPKDELYAKYPRALPADSWYSTEPYIDAQVRKERFERIVIALYDAGFPVGAWAARVIEDVKLARDPARVTSALKMRPVHTEESAAAVTPTADIVEAGKKTTEAAEDSVDAAAPRKVVPIQMAKSVTADKTKPLAEPPMHGKVGTPPRIVRKLGTHDIVFYDGWYYGVPHALGTVDVSQADTTSLSGVVRHATEAGVLEVIEEASRWANSRGQYDSQKQQRAGGTYMRADSALGESPPAVTPTTPHIVRFRTDYVALRREDIAAAFTRSLSRESSTSDDFEQMQTLGQTRVRRLAGKLPIGLQQEIRRLIRQQAMTRGDANGPLRTRSDASLLGMLWRGAIQTYVKTPLSQLGRSHRQEQIRERIPGSDIAVVNVVTKNALPELLWTIDNYNVVKFDGSFYALPHGQPIDWEMDVATVSGVLVAKSAQDIAARLRERGTSIAGQTGAQGGTGAGATAMGPAGEASSAPTLLGSVLEYNIVSYEGWIYGIPQSLGPIDLTVTDIMEMPDVVRDVSRDVVESEILERARIAQRQVA